MNATITSEYEGNFTQVSIEEILDFLTNMKEISINFKDFINKVTNGLTDETSSLSEKDQKSLSDWYFKRTI